MGQIYDFTEYKLHQLMESAAETQRYDIADDLRVVLDGYLLGELSIEWVSGWPRPCTVNQTTPRPKQNPETVLNS